VAELTELSQGCVDPTHQTWPGHRAIIAALHFISDLGYLLCFNDVLVVM